MTRGLHGVGDAVRGHVPDGPAKTIPQAARALLKLGSTRDALGHSNHAPDGDRDQHQLLPDAAESNISPLAAFWVG